MNMDSTFRIPPHVIAREVGEEMVILDLQQGSYLGLDPVGARIWTLLGEGRTVKGICAVMREEYEVAPDVLERDVLELVEELVSDDLVAVEE